MDRDRAPVEPPGRTIAAYPNQDEARELVDEPQKRLRVEP